MKKAAHIFIYIFAFIGFALVAMYVAVQFGWTKTPGIIDRQHDFFKKQNKDANMAATSTERAAWQDSEEWTTLKQAIVKDTDSINSVAKKTGISSRTIVAVLIVEQLRLFNSNREVFKAIFSPLKILGNQSQFSWGVMGIKQDTAKMIEEHLKDANSPFYLGTSFEHMLDFTTDNHDNERFERLTNEDDRTYSYLYAALALKQFVAQWDKASSQISDRPEILATLFNIGFQNSKPKKDPQPGGAEIQIGSETYSFGGLAGSFYYSNELRTEFPK